MNHPAPTPAPQSLSAIARLNDALRQDMASSGHDRIMMTAGVVAFIGDTTHFRGFHRRKALLRAVRDYAAFGPDNDPHGEHDFGGFALAGEQFFWKIDYYDRALEYGSPDPADRELTCRVLTILLTSEY